MDKAKVEHGAHGQQRRSLRLGGYDYSQEGAYFVTIVTQGRECLFGEVNDRQMSLNRAGEMVSHVWKGLPIRFPNVRVDNIVVMPNHIHGIVDILNVGAPLVGAPARRHTDGLERNGATTRVAPTLGMVIGAFKSLTTVQYARCVQQEEWPAFQGRLWQRNYYEHIIRNAESRRSILEYLAANPANWENDPENPLSLA